MRLVVSVDGVSSARVRLDGSRDASAPRRAVFPLAGSDVVFRNSPRGASLTRPTTARAWRGEGERRWRPRRGALGLPGRVAANGRRPSQEKPFRPLLGEEIARRHGFHHFLPCRRARRPAAPSPQSPHALRSRTLSCRRAPRRRRGGRAPSRRRWSPSHSGCSRAAAPTRCAGLFARTSQKAAPTELSSRCAAAFVRP